MRLTAAEQDIISRAIKARDPGARIYLFGSRADDHAHGGDIDLMVVSGSINIWDRLDILAELHQRLGDQKIDLVVSRDSEQPFARVALAEGVAL
jgi:predicted nucleotidyltransferase